MRKAADLDLAQKLPVFGEEADLARHLFDDGEIGA